MRNKFYIIILLLASLFILINSCRKINLLSPSIIPPPTEFPNNGQIPEYPTPSPTMPIPPEKTE